MNRKFYSFLSKCLILSALFILSSCSNKSYVSSKVNFIVQLKKPLTGQKIYVTGNKEVLGIWNPAAVPMDRQSDTVWIKKVLLKQGDKIEFKFTKGTWNTEAVDEGGWIKGNLTATIYNDTTIRITIPKWKDNIYERMITPLSFEGSDPGLKLINNWKYHTGDNMQWASENFNDSSWETVTSALITGNLPQSGWKNVGWFRTHFIVDSSLWNKTYVYLIGQLGASEVYLNGRLIGKYGLVGNSGKSYVPEQNRLWHEIKFDPQKHQVIAVRYANYSAGSFMKYGFDAGFAIYIRELNTILDIMPGEIRSTYIYEMTFTLIPLILFFFHIILYGFYRKQRQNLFYAICLLGFAGLTYFRIERYVATVPEQIIFYYMMNGISAAVTIFFGTVTAFSITLERLPKYWIASLLLAVAVVVLSVIYPLGNISSINIYVYFAISMLAIIYFSFKKGKKKQKGSWIIFTGFIILSAFIIYQILIDYSFVTPLFNIQPVFVYGMLGLAVSMSIFLAYNFAYVNKDLELQLTNVKVLSERALAQEKLAGKIELERKLVEAENKRTLKELEEARQLQLSLLPKQVPKIEGLDIACFMKTASEVGGDYYDFFLHDNKSLTTVIGDATGHGLKAGNMVIVTKGLLNILSGNGSLDEIMNSSNRAIKKMNLYMLTMCLAAVKIKDHNLEYSSAGMPPILIFRNSSGLVENIILKAMPLGAFYDFPYGKIETLLQVNDVILLMSDGLTELFNKDKEDLGIDKVGELLKESSGGSADDILKYIFDKCRQWSEGMQISDDITIVAIKVLS